jgi:hypothetical protein
VCVDRGAAEQVVLEVEMDIRLSSLDDLEDLYSLCGDLRPAVITGKHDYVEGRHFL